MKDIAEKEDRQNVIYKINCKNCNKAYIGETGQNIKNRIKQHKYNVGSPKNINKTALANHAIKHTHGFDFSNVKVLSSEGNVKCRKIKEAIYITKNINETVNFRSDTQSICNNYANIIHNLNI